MAKIKSILILVCVCLLATSGIIGCTATRRAAVILPEPTCAEAVSNGIHNLSDNELHKLLSQAKEDRRLEDCWIPLMKASLDTNRDLPLRHLKTAIKVFNKRRTESYFHKAVYRYYAGLINRPDNYDRQSRNLLESYVSYLINKAETNRDIHLVHAKLVCRKLDRNLYTRLLQ